MDFKAVISIHALRVEGDLAAAEAATAKVISIHALRVEGDKIPLQELEIEIVFLSTPSGWRATAGTSIATFAVVIFLSTPSGWRATCEDYAGNFWQAMISIHALRVEGDPGR